MIVRTIREVIIIIVSLVTIAIIVSTLVRTSLEGTYTKITTPPRSSLVSSTPVHEIPNFLDEHECRTIIELSGPKLFESQVYTEKSNVYDTDTRVSMQCWLDNDEGGEVMKRVTEKMNNLVGLTSGHAEDMQVVKYSGGGFFKPHYDACVGGETFCDRMDSGWGPRYATVLIYLNDDFRGGETAFPKKGISIKPERGKAVLFYSSDPEGSLIEDSLHGGNSVENGNKWICNKWYHLRQR